MARILGMDIGEHHIRGVLVKTQLRSVSVEKYVSASISSPISSIGVNEPEAHDEFEDELEELGDEHEDEVAVYASVPLERAIQDVLAQCGRAPDMVITALDGQLASIRSVTLPVGASKRIAEVLPFEIEALLPFSLEDAILSHQIAHTTDIDVEVLASAVPKERISSYLDMLEAAGVQPREVAVGAAALDGLTSLVNELNAPGPFLLVYVGSGSLDLCVLQEGRCTFARTLEGGARDLVTNIDSEALSSVEQALKRTLTIYFSQNEALFSNVFVGGEFCQQSVNAEIESTQLVLDRLTAVIGAECCLLSLPEASETDAIEDADAMAHGAFLKAAALAGRTSRGGTRFDLRQAEFSVKRSVVELKRYAKLFAFCAVFFLLAFSFSAYARYAMVHERQAALQRELGDLSQSLLGKRVESPTRVSELIGKAHRASDPRPSFDAYQILQAVIRSIPEEIEHKTTQFNVSIEDEDGSGHFELRGQVRNVRERDVWVSALEKHRCITQVERGRTTPDAASGTLKYRIDGTIQCPEDPLSFENENESESAKSLRRRNRGPS